MLRRIVNRPLKSMDSMVTRLINDHLDPEREKVPKGDSCYALKDSNLVLHQGHVFMVELQVWETRHDPFNKSIRWVLSDNLTPEETFNQFPAKKWLVSEDDVRQIQKCVNSAWDIKSKYSNTMDIKDVEELQRNLSDIATILTQYQAGLRP